MKRALLTLTAGVLLVVSQARADYTVSKYRELMASKDETVLALMKMYLSGLGSGLFWANVFVDVEKRTQLYCPPSGLSLKPDNYIDILDKQIKLEATKRTEVDLGGQWIGTLMLLGLENTFPCPAK